MGREILRAIDRFCMENHNYSAYPHPKSLSPGRGISIRLPFSHWEKGLGDEGKLDIELAA